jgi:hypothetical protein
MDTIQQASIFNLLQCLYRKGHRRAKYFLDKLHDDRYIIKVWSTPRKLLLPTKIRCATSLELFLVIDYAIVVKSMSLFNSRVGEIWQELHTYTLEKIIKLHNHSYNNATSLSKASCFEILQKLIQYDPTNEKYQEIMYCFNNLMSLELRAKFVLQFDSKSKSSMNKPTEVDLLNILINKIHYRVNFVTAPSIHMLYKIAADLRYILSTGKLREFTNRDGLALYKSHPNFSDVNTPASASVPDSNKFSSITKAIDYLYEKYPDHGTCTSFKMMMQNQDFFDFAVKKLQKLIDKNEPITITYLLATIKLVMAKWRTDRLFASIIN